VLGVEDLIKEAGTEVEEGKVIDKIIEAEIKEEAEEETFGDKTDTSQKRSMNQT